MYLKPHITGKKMSKIILERPPENDDELYYLVKALWGVTIPRHKVCPDHIAPFEAFADAYWNRDGSISLWHGSRGLSGKSFMLSILGITKAFIQGADVNLLGGSLAQSVNIHEHMRAAFNNTNAPSYMIETEANTQIKLSNKARIRPLTASQKTVRGPHPPFLILDEIDEMAIDILDAALGQPMPQTNWQGEVIMPYSVLCSTWQNADGTFAEVKRRFEEEGLPVKSWCYRESANEIDGWLLPETIEAKKREIPKEMWRVEYELGEPSIGNRAFDTDAVEKTFNLPLEPIAEVKKDRYEEYEFEKPVSDGVYVVAADWAKEQDFTVISVIRVDRQPHTLVHYRRVNRRPYPMMINWFNEAIDRYNAAAIHDATGLGNVVNDYIDVRARKFIMTGEKRSNMLTEYVGAIERGFFTLPKINTLYTAHKYCRTGDLYDNSKDFHLPDEVCSMALGWHVAKKFSGYGEAITVTRKGDFVPKMEKPFHVPTQEESTSIYSPKTEGEVRKKTASDEGISLTV